MILPSLLRQNQRIGKKYKPCKKMVEVPLAFTVPLHYSWWNDLWPDYGHTDWIFADQVMQILKKYSRMVVDVDLDW